MPGEHACPDRSARRGSTGAARPRSGGRAAGSRPGRGRSADRARQRLPSPAFPIHTAGPAPGVRSGAAGAARAARRSHPDPDPMGTPPAHVGPSRALRSRDAGDGRCQDPVPSWPARPCAVALRPDDGRRSIRCDSSVEAHALRLALGAAAWCWSPRVRQRPTTPTRAGATAPRQRAAPAPPVGRAHPERAGRRDRPVQHGLRARRRPRRRHRHHRRLAGGDPVQPVLPDPGHGGQRRRRPRGPRSRPSPTTTSTRPTSRRRSRRSTTAASRSRATTATR